MKIKTKKEGKGIILLPIIAVIIVFVSSIVLSLSFSSSPSINSGYLVYTYEDVVCDWEQSGDTTSTNVTWYKNGVSQFTFVAAGTSHTLNKDNTTKNDEWICEVKLINSTDELAQNATVNISNSPQTVPILYNSAKDTIIPTNYSLYEDSSYTFYINSTDADLDTLTFGIEYDEASLCTLVSSTTGEITCIATHAKIAGTSNNTPEAGVQKYFWPKARANNPGLSIYDDNRTFFLVPVNDQALFNQTLPDTSINSDSSWILILNASDEENDFPLNFTFASDILTSFPGLMTINSIDNVTANLTFNTPNSAPDNIHSGNWTIYLNVTDVNQSNTTREPDQFNFTLEIITTNHAPDFITNFSALSITGNQTESFLLYINANDSDENDTVNFSVSVPVSGCYDIFPWHINTTNSSYINATGIINVTVLNNSHVACRYLNISVYDQESATTSEIVFFNISNVNDAPVLSEISLDGVNMSSQQKIYKYSSYTYRINATDIDNKTYDTSNTGTLTYYTNETLFPVNSTSGVINLIVDNDSYVDKNWTINITISDSIINVSRIMLLEILNNSAPTLNLSYNNLTFYQNESVEINFTSWERDNETMNLSMVSLTQFNVSKYNITNLSNDYSDGNLKTWLLNMTNPDSRLANDNVGSHLIQINISDSTGASEENVSTGILNFTILNTNDAPFFDSDKDNASDQISFGNLTENFTFSFIINATDFDLFLGSEYANDVLTFDYANASNGISSNLSFTKTSNNTALLQFTPNETGNLSITLNVTDSNGTYHNQTINFEVLLPTSKPVFEQINPYHNSTTNLTVNNFTTASSYMYNITGINISENQTWVFDAIISNDTSYPNNDMIIKWYIDNELNDTILSYSSVSSANLTMEFGFFSNRNINITMEATDSRGSASNWTWVANVTNINRAPGINSSLPNIENISGTTQITDYFTIGENNTVRFYDYDLTQLNYTMNFVSPTSGCSVFSFSASSNSIIITPETSDGICVVNFTATDDYGAFVDSNDVVISVEGFVPSSGSSTTSSQSGGSSTRTQIVTVPFEEEVDKPVPIKIVAPGTVSTYANKTIEIPITLENTWEEEISGISLSGVALNASLVDEPNVTIQFSESFFPAIPFGGEVNSVLTISEYRKEGPFEITIFAKVNDPDFTDTATILINSLEQSSIGDDVKSKVTFAKDMLSDNPECRELNELLDRADAAVNSGNFADAVNLVDAVINGCKFLINQREDVRRETPSILQTGFDFAEKYYLEIIYGAALILILTLILYAGAAVKKKLSEIK